MEYQEADIECLTFTVPGPSSVCKTEVKSAWKGLMQKMQENQKKPIKSSTKNSKNTKSVNPSAIKHPTINYTSPALKSFTSKENLAFGENEVSSSKRGSDSRFSQLHQEIGDNSAANSINLNKNDINGINRVKCLEYIAFGDKSDKNYSEEDVEGSQPRKRRRLDSPKRTRYFLKQIENNIDSYSNNEDLEDAADFCTPFLKRRVAHLGADASASELRYRVQVAQSSCSTSNVDQAKAKSQAQAPPPAPQQLFSIFTSNKDKQQNLSSSTFVSTYNFNYVIYDYPEIKDGWQTSDKTEIMLNDRKSELSAEISAINNNKQKPRSCPFYKKIPGTRFSVDAFSYGKIPGIDVYFLSHFHSDHYVGLTKKFSDTTIVCSRPTGNLVEMKLGVPKDCIRKLELNKVYIIQGTEVVLLEANHCPGSVMFIFRLTNGSTIFHTGDFRYTPDILTSPFVKSIGRVSSLYLDTTYCDPKYDFPSQSDSVNQVILTVRKHLSIRPNTLIVCGAYCIGKERVFFTLAEAINTKVFCSKDKYRMLYALDNPAFKEFMKDVEQGCNIHVVSMRDLNSSFLSTYLEQRSTKYNNILAIKPSGWEFKSAGQGFSIKTYLKDTVSIIGVPYSEHSSFSELEGIVKALKPIKIQPTVNVGNETKRNQMMSFIDQWLKS